MNNIDVEEILEKSVLSTEKNPQKMTANELFSAVSTCVFFENIEQLKNLFDKNPNISFSNAQIASLTNAVLESFNREIYELLKPRKVFIDLLDILPHLATNNTEMIAYCVEQLNEFEKKFTTIWNTATTHSEKKECEKRLKLTNSIISSVFIKHSHISNCEPIRQWFLNSSLYSTPNVKKVHCFQLLNVFVKGLLSNITFDERLSDVFDKNSDFWKVFDQELFYRYNTASAPLFKNLNKHPVFKDKVFNRDRDEWKKQDQWMSSLKNCQTSDEEISALNKELDCLRKKWPYMTFYSPMTENQGEGYSWGPDTDNKEKVKWSTKWEQMGMPLRALLSIGTTELNISCSSEMWFNHEPSEVYPSFLHGVIANGHENVLVPLLDNEQACKEITRILREEEIFLLYFTARTSWNVVKQLVDKDSSWAIWTDKNGNTLAHYMMGIAPAQLCSSSREDKDMVMILNHLENINPSWLIAENNNGVVVKDLLLKNTFASTSSNLEALVSQKILTLAIAEQSLLAPISKTMRKI